MNKKILIITSIVLVISFSAGIFTAIAISPEKITVAADMPDLADSLMDYIKSDLITVLAAILFSGLVFLMPAVALMVIGKTFSLGFSAAFVLSSFEEKGIRILMATLLPRGIFKIPAYVALVFFSLQLAAFLYKNHRNKAALHGAIPILRGYMICFFVLIISSALEVCLLQAIL